MRGALKAALALASTAILVSPVYPAAVQTSDAIQNFPASDFLDTKLMFMPETAEDWAEYEKWKDVDFDSIHRDINNRIFSQLFAANKDNSTTLAKRGPEDLEEGDLNRCAVVWADKGIPGGVHAWNMVIEKDHRYDSDCGISFLDQWRGRCHFFPVFIKNWRCDRIDYLFLGTPIEIPVGTVWISFVTKPECNHEWGRDMIMRATKGSLRDIQCSKFDLDNLPIPYSLSDINE